jgi:hypothetical protein
MKGDAQETISLAHLMEGKEETERDQSGGRENPIRKVKI